MEAWCPASCYYRIELVQYLTQTRAGSNKMQRQTQSLEQTLSVYLDVDVVEDSKQSKARITTRRHLPPRLLYVPTADCGLWQEAQVVT